MFQACAHVDREIVRRVSRVAINAEGVGTNRHRCCKGQATRALNGVRFDLLDRDAFVRYTRAFVRCGESHVVHFLAADPTARATREPPYCRILNAGDLNIADGQPVAWAMRLMGAPATRIAGTDGLSLLCDAGLAVNAKHYLYGGTARVSTQLCAELARRYEGIQIVGAETPAMGMPPDGELVSSATRIRAAGTELLWMRHRDAEPTPGRQQIARA